VVDIEQAEFLSRQFDLLLARLDDPAIEWQDIADLRSEYTGENEHRDTIRKGSKLFYEYFMSILSFNYHKSQTNKYFSLLLYRYHKTFFQKV